MSKLVIRNFSRNVLEEKPTHINVVRNNGFPINSESHFSVNFKLESKLISKQKKTDNKSDNLSLICTFHFLLGH